MSRPQFITDNLVKVSKPIRVFRDMINLLDTDNVEFVRQETLSSLYSILFDTFNNMHHNYDFDELLFIAKRMYNRSGVKESLELLNQYFDLKLIITINSDYTIDILIEEENEVFKDLDLGLIQIKELTRDLLFYGSASFTLDKATFQIDMLNTVITVSSVSDSLFLDRYHDRTNIIVKEIA